MTSGKTHAVRVSNRMSRNENSFAAQLLWLCMSFMGGGIFLALVIEPPSLKLSIRD